MHSSFTPRTKPPALQPGDTVGIVAPASNIKRELLDKGCEALRQHGYRPFYFDSILEHDWYFAGSVERRARELEENVCARGCKGDSLRAGRVWRKLSAAHARPQKKSEPILRSLSATVT